jgi:hypothetical protein
MSLSFLQDIRKVFANLNADEIRGAAWQDLNIGLMASSDEAYSRMENFLAPPLMDDFGRRQALRAVHRANGSPSPFDFVLYEPGIPAPQNGYPFESDESGSLVESILGEHRPLELALARTFPLFRIPVSHGIINRVSRENALFSIMTALPNVIPSMFELPWTIGEFATDTAFLTMNQIRMALILSAAHGRPVGYGEQKMELGAIVAGAFGWRALARELVGKIPLGGGLIPKAAVAFAGTWVVGMGLEKVNRTGSGLSREERRDAYADAFAKGREIAAEILPHHAEARDRSIGDLSGRG